MNKCLFLLVFPLLFFTVGCEDDSTEINEDDSTEINEDDNSNFGTIGYLLDTGEDIIYKTTDSGTNWTQVTDLDSQFNFIEGTISFVN